MILYCPSCKKIALKYEEVGYTYGADADGNRGIECTDLVCPECGCELDERKSFTEKEFKDILRHASEKDLRDLLIELIYKAENAKEEIIDVIYNCYDDDYVLDECIEDLPDECINV